MSSEGCPQPRTETQKCLLKFYHKDFSLFYARLGTARATMRRQLYHKAF